MRPNGAFVPLGGVRTPGPGNPARAGGLRGWLAREAWPAPAKRSPRRAEAS